MKYFTVYGRWVLWASCFSSLAVPVKAIVIQDASTPTYVTSNSAFSGVVSILFNENGDTTDTFICSGSLIAPNYILTAGHCVNNDSNWSVTFQTASGTTTVGVANTYLDPLFTPYPSNSALAGLDEYDVAVIQLSSAAPLDAQIYGLDTNYAGVTPSTPLNIVGYGLGGSPAVGILNTGTRRAAQQTVAGVLSSLDGVPTPDNPLFMEMEFNGSDPSNYGLANGGDSGGPALLGNEIVGVADFADLPRTGSYATNVVYDAGYENLANPQIAAFVEQFTVPEPQTYFLAFAGLAFFGIAVRRSRRTPGYRTSSFSIR